MTIKTTFVTVPTPGTPVQVTTLPDVAYRIVVAPAPWNTGKIWPGLSNLNKTTNAGVVHRPMLASAGEIELRSRDFGGNELRPSDLYIDADVANEGAFVTWYIA